MRSKLSTAMFAAKKLALNFANKSIHISEIQGLPRGDLAFLLLQELHSVDIRELIYSSAMNFRSTLSKKSGHQFLPHNYFHGRVLYYY